MCSRIRFRIRFFRTCFVAFVFHLDRRGLAVDEKCKHTTQVIKQMINNCEIVVTSLAENVYLLIVFLRFCWFGICIVSVLQTKGDGD